MGRRLKGPIVVNILWLFLDKGYGAILTLILYSKLASYFGVSMFGVWNYMLSFAALIPAIASLGLNFIVVKELKLNPNIHDIILSTTFHLKLITGIIVCFVLLILYIIIGINTGDGQEYVFIFLLISQTVLNFNVYIQKNESLLKNRTTVIARNLSLTIFFILKLLSIRYNQSMLLFAILNMLEFLTFFLIISRKENLLDILKISNFDKSLALKLVKSGFPLMLAAITTTLYLKIDQLFIAYYMTNEDVGLYAAASRISEFLYALPVIISTVYFPKLLKINRISLYKLMDQLFSIVVISSVFCIVIITLFSDFIIKMMYGSDFVESSKILSIHVWSLIFMGLLVSSSKYIIAIDRPVLILYREILGLSANLILNYILIPVYGIAGAAYATLVSYALSSYGANMFFKELRPIIKHQTFSLYFIIKEKFVL